MKIKTIFRVIACLITAGIALLLVQTVFAGRVNSYLTPWLFRHVPFMIYWGTVQPEGIVATWGGEDYNTLYVFTQNGCVYSYECIYPDGLYKTSDFGLSWEPITATVLGAGPLDFQLSLIATHPISPNLMFSVAHLGPPIGIYRSIDYGETWTQVRSNYIYDIEVDPNHPNVIYLATGGWPGNPEVGIYRSEDYGASWVRIADNLFNDLEMVGDNSGVMYAARTFTTNDYEGVYRSTDRGLT